MPNAQCPMPNAQCPINHSFARLARHQRWGDDAAANARELPLQRISTWAGFIEDLHPARMYRLRFIRQLPRHRRRLARAHSASPQRGSSCGASIPTYVVTSLPSLRLWRRNRVPEQDVVFETPSDPTCPHCGANAVFSWATNSRRCLGGILYFRWRECGSMDFALEAKSSK